MLYILDALGLLYSQNFCMDFHTKGRISSSSSSHGYPAGMYLSRVQFVVYLNVYWPMLKLGMTYPG